MSVHTISLTDQLVQGKGYIASDMGEEKVMLSIENGKYYNLGEIGGAIWDLMQAPTTVNDIVSSLIADYNVEKETCEEQVITFIHQLLKEGIVEFVSRDQNR